MHRFLKYIYKYQIYLLGVRLRVSKDYTFHKLPLVLWFKLFAGLIFIIQKNLPIYFYTDGMEFELKLKSYCLISGCRFWYCSLFCSLCKIKITSRLKDTFLPPGPVSRCHCLGAVRWTVGVFSSSCLSSSHCDRLGCPARRRMRGGRGRRLRVSAAPPSCLRDPGQLT